jgi:hypothetical protein
MTAIATRIEESSVGTPWVFDPRAWWKDTRLLSEGARGVWIDMLCLMKCAKYPGYLVNQAGEPITDDFLSRHLRIHPRRLQGYLQEIRDRGMYSVDSRGWVYSRRIVRELNSPEKPPRVERWRQIQSSPPAELLDWVTWWNGLVDLGLVHCKHTTSKPNEDLCKGWARVEKSRELAELLSNKQNIERAIRNATFDLKWLSLASLFGGKNRDGEYKVRRLLEGRYGNADEQQSKTIERLGGLAEFVREQRGVG